MAMEDLMKILLILFGLYGVIVSICLLTNYNLVGEQTAIGRGHAEFVADTTNGTIKFEWIELD
jgi:hypothetical protein